MSSQGGPASALPGGFLLGKELYFTPGCYSLGEQPTLQGGFSSETSSTTSAHVSPSSPAINFSPKNKGAGARARRLGARSKDRAQCVDNQCAKEPRPRGRWGCDILSLMCVRHVCVRECVCDTHTGHCGMCYPSEQLENANHPTTLPPPPSRLHSSDYQNSNWGGRAAVLFTPW